MHKIIATLVAFTMLSVMVPAAQAGTYTTEYSIAFGARVNNVGDANPGFALIACQGPPEGPICEENDLAPIGGYGIDPVEDPITDAILTVNDNNFDSTYTSGCIYVLPAHSSCGGVKDATTGETYGDVSFSGCGVAASGPVSVTDVDHIAGFVYNARVDADTLEVCMGSSGSVTAIIN